MSRHEERRKELLLAIKKIEVGRPTKIDKDRELSIVAVADEVGIDPSTIHTRYPDVAQLIRDKTGKGETARRDAMALALDEEKRKNAILRGTVDEMRLHLTNLASKFAAAQSELESIKSINSSGGKVRSIAGRKK